MPYTLYFKPITKRGGLLEAIEAESATHALHQRRKLIASDHVVTLIKAPDGRRLGLTILRPLQEQSEAETRILAPEPLSWGHVQA